ncbi:PadR family transcriptional regulator [Paenibacillus methanolicus]|uniref:PadR family transcriptional regulator n=1 Tax=Paenibacillus methanolicus TaxID=582686 RepID=A0A5S5CN24_9BACL|nr:PadR family transcriptional regulator [Paenibacillus methanolicus]TYP79768.1 PadR family transcriptional regulator [Paenibacillus methanolicus]
MAMVWQEEERLFVHDGSERDSTGTGRRYFSRGGVKYALLELLMQSGMHGYQMMKALEEQSDGTYKPSAGTIYPTLQMLRDQGFVNASKVDGKKVFEITEEGKVYLQAEKELQQLQENEAKPAVRDEAEPPASEVGQEQPQEETPQRKRRLTPAGKELIHLMKAAEREALQDPAKAAMLRAALHGLRFSLRQILEEDRTDAGEAP